MLLKPLSYLDLKVNMFRFQASEVLSSLRNLMKGDIHALKSFVLGLITNFRSEV